MDEVLSFDERAAPPTLMDDAYMAAFFDGQPCCAEEVLRAVLDMPDLQVVSLEVERGLVNLQGRSARLDVFAVDGEGRLYDIEVQRDTSRASPRRARFYAALMDASALPKGADFDELPTSYVVFICDGDALGGHQPLYRVDRTVAETGRSFADGSHIVYADASYTYDGDEPTRLGDVMHDFLCADPERMRCPAFAERARYLRTTDEGRRDMGTWSEDLIRIGREDTVALLAKDGTLSYEEIARIFKVRVEDVERYVSAYEKYVEHIDTQQAGQAAQTA